MKKKVMIGIIVVVVIISLIGLKMISTNKTKYTAVKTTKVVKGEVKAYLSTTGTVKSKSNKEYFGPQLKVKKINVKIGDSIKKGQVLVTYDTADLNNSLQQARIQYNNAILQKQDTLNQRDTINKKISELDSQISTLSSSKNPADQQMLATLKQQRSGIQTISNERIQQLTNSVDLAKINLDSVTSKVNEGNNGIVAENAGVVTAINITAGGFGNAAAPAVVVQDISNLKVVVSLGKYDASKIKINQQVEIKNNNGQKFKGKVSLIDPVAKKSAIPGTGNTTLNTEIDVIDKPENLKIGFDVDIAILLGKKDGILKVPAECIKTDKNGNDSIFIIENEKAVEKKVKLGLQSDLDVQILEGLKEGDKVILNPSASIHNGSLVKDEVEAVK